MKDLEKLTKLIELLEPETKTETKDHPYKIGKNYVIRTVTMIEVGKLVAVYEKELVLEDASWIADTGRFHDFLKTGQANEVEPFTDDAIIGRGALIDCQVFNHTLPKDQK